MRKYRRITYEDRCQIYALSKRGASQESIAGVLGVSQSTMSREMCRNRGQRGYRFKQAEAKAQARQAIRSRPRKLTAPCWPRPAPGFVENSHRRSNAKPPRHKCAPRRLGPPHVSYRPTRRASGRQSETHRRGSVALPSVRSSRR